MRRLFFIFFMFFFVFCGATQKTVFLAILARNKAHTLPLFLDCLDHLVYEKKLITVYIKTNDNNDNTEEILEYWITKNRDIYGKIIYENHELISGETTDPHAWNPNRFKILSEIRNKSLEIAYQENSDFYFVVDCDNFIEPCTLETLIKENKPIIAPMLVSIPEKGDRYSNFFCAIDNCGYYKHHQDYDAIFDRKYLGTFSVPVVHCTYLIKRQYIPLLNYQDDTNDYEFVIFSRIARQQGIKQYICNKKFFGYLVHFYNNVTLSQEKEILDNIISCASLHK